MEPEKKDVWEIFDDKFNVIHAPSGQDFQFKPEPDGIKAFVLTHFIPRAEVVEKVKQIIMCKKCNGQGAILGDKLGVLECEDCGGDGHCLYNREGEKLDDLLDLLTQEKEIKS